MSRLRHLVAGWFVPAIWGVAGAALLITGTKAGGWIGWATIAAATLGLAASIVLVVRANPFADEWDEPDESETPARR